MKLETIIERSKTSAPKGQVLLIHGACMGAWCWSDNFQPWFAEAGYDVYAISLRNHAGSEKKGKLRFKSVSEYVDDLKQIIETRPGPTYLIGHSMGGFIIQHYLTQPSQKVQKAVLLCASPPQGNLSIIPRLLKDITFPFLKALLNLSWLPIFKEKRNARKVMFSHEFPEEKLEKVLLQMQDESFLAFLEMTALNLPDYRKVITPLLIIGGEKDYLIPEKATRNMAELYKSDVTIISNAPHNVMMEPGWEKVAETIERFFHQIN
ncbi:MAG: alpha/beta hydrolase [Chitinophagaceae bacterium]